MLSVPIYLSITFILTTLLTLYLFHQMIARSNKPSPASVIAGILAVVLILQGVLAYIGFYSSQLNMMPPRLMIFGALPNLIVILILFWTKWGRDFIDGFRFYDLTMLSIVRIPVELCLYGLALHKAVPELMSFAGRNFDIFAGITAPLVVYFMIKKPKAKRMILWIWNVIGVILLLNIIVHAILSAPFLIQQMAFDQPNVAVLHFPFIWLPVFVAPLVLLTHFISIRKLLYSA
jgi:hypothetical protein